MSPYDNLSDDEAVHILKTSYWQGEVIYSHEGMGTSATRISEDTVVKSLLYSVRAPFEAFTMSLVRSQTSIPVPKVRKSVFWDNHWWIFMEYIEGEDARQVWDQLGDDRRQEVARHIHNYVVQLRKVSVPGWNVPGPIDDSRIPLECFGHYFPQDGVGPFDSYAALTTWFYHKRRVATGLIKRWVRARDQTYTPTNVQFDDSHPLVLIHGDIARHNVRLGSDGTVWLMDWGLSGFYPPWFEYAGMAAYGKNHQEYSESWLSLGPYITGDFSAQTEFLKQMEASLAHPYLEEYGEE